MRVRRSKKKEREREGDKSRDLKINSRDLFTRWKGLKTKRKKKGTVTTRGRGWEKKRPGGNQAKP